MAQHAFKCTDCNAEVDVKVKIGEDAEVPECPNFQLTPREDGLPDLEHAMKRVWSLTGFSIEW